MQKQNVQNVRAAFVRQFREFQRNTAISHVVDKTGVKLLELTGVSFTADEPAIFGTPDQDYITRELLWYESQNCSVRSMKGKVPAIWESICVPSNGMVNSNYGYLIYNSSNGYQYTSCRTALLENPATRRAIMIYTRPEMQRDWNVNGMNDFVCTNTVQYLIRNEKLEVIVNMRSNDVVFGYRNDWAWQKWVQKRLLDDLLEKYPTLELGDITWQVGSLHVYERHFKFIEEYLQKFSNRTYAGNGFTEVPVTGNAPARFPENTLIRTASTGVR